MENNIYSFKLSYDSTKDKLYNSFFCYIRVIKI